MALRLLLIALVALIPAAKALSCESVNPLKFNSAPKFCTACLTSAVQPPCFVSEGSQCTNAAHETRHLMVNTLDDCTTFEFMKRGHARIPSVFDAVGGPKALRSAAALPAGGGAPSSASAAGAGRSKKSTSPPGGLSIDEDDSSPPGGPSIAVDRALNRKSAGAMAPPQAVHQRHIGAAAASASGAGAGAGAAWRVDDDDEEMNHIPIRPLADIKSAGPSASGAAAGDTYIYVPSAFRPPMIGDFEMLSTALQKYPDANVYIVIPPLVKHGKLKSPTRNGISGDTSAAIWQIFFDYIQTAGTKQFVVTTEMDPHHAAVTNAATKCKQTLPHRCYILTNPERASYSETFKEYRKQHIYYDVMKADTGSAARSKFCGALEQLRKSGVKAIEANSKEFAALEGYLPKPLSTEDKVKILNMLLPTATAAADAIGDVKQGAPVRAASAAAAAGSAMAAAAHASF